MQTVLRKGKGIIKSLADTLQSFNYINSISLRIQKNCQLFSWLYFRSVEFSGKNYSGVEPVSWDCGHRPTSNTFLTCRWSLTLVPLEKAMKHVLALKTVFSVSAKAWEAEI